MKRKKERRKRNKEKDEEYLIQYTRHLEERLKNLKVVNLKLKEELKNLQNEKD